MNLNVAFNDSAANGAVDDVLLAPNASGRFRFVVRRLGKRFTLKFDAILLRKKRPILLIETDLQIPWSSTMGRDWQDISMKL